MRIYTTTLGPVEATPDSFLTLPDGLLGYEEHRDYALVAPSEYAPFRWLLSFADPGLSFPVLDPRTIVPDYAPELTAGDRRALSALETDPLEILVLTSLDAATGRMTLNLRAPIVVNLAHRLARQIVLSDGRYEINHEVVLAGSERTASTRSRA